MKKVLLSLVALAAMVACNNEETVVVDRHSLITFDNSFVEVKTRVEDPSITTASIDAFDVWGFIDQPSGTVFSQEHVTKNAAENKWEYANLQYWLPNHIYYFYAVAPANAIAPLQNASIEVDTTGMNINGLGTINFTNVNGTLDLLYAEQTKKTEADVITNDPGKVSLQFMHLLSKVMFTFKNAFTNDNATLKVTGLKIVDAPKKGSVEVNKERTGYAWVIAPGETTTLEFGDVNGGAAFNVGESKLSDRERLTIPADATRSYTIEFDLTLYYGDQVAGTSHKSVALENHAFAIGKNYNIVAAIGPENFADDALAAIEFDVITVEEWGDPINVDDKLDYDNPGGNNGGNQGGNEEPTQPVALATPVVTATVDGNIVTLTWEAIEGAAEYTVQVDDDVVETVNDTTYTFEGDYEVEYTFTVKAIAADTEKNTNSESVVVKATTEANPADSETPAEGSAITVEKFLELADTETEYELTGKITRVVNTQYGNFDLTDDTDTIYVHGLLTPEGEQQKQWAAAGLREGDTITIKGKYNVYNNSAQIKNATYVSHVAAPFVTASVAAVEASATSATINVESNLAWTVSCSASWISSYTPQSGNGNGTIEVAFAENTVEESRQATFTLTADSLSYEVTLVQKAKPASGVEGGSADWSSAATNTSYTTNSVNGWSYTNCAIFQGGTTDSSPKFKMIGDAANRALCMNGHTSKVGTIESPEFTTGCGTLTFNYGLPFSDTKMKFRVDIIQDGAVVHTFTIENASATKLTTYSHEEVVNVSGTFKMVFTNLSPSQKAENKDRTAIWDVEWTGKN